MVRLRMGGRENREIKGEREGRREKEVERDKFECRFEEIGKGGEMTEIGKRVVKIFLIFERELYTFIIMGIV